MLPDFETLIKDIRAKRKELDWSQKKLANRAGVSQSLIAKLEQKKNVPNYKSTRKIYETLKRNISSGTETAGDLVNPEIVSVRLDDKKEKVAEIMKENDFSQIPVKNGESYIGIVVSKDIGLAEDETPVGEIMRRTIPIVPEETSREALTSLLKTNRAVLVKGKEGKVKGIITPADLL